MYQNKTVENIFKSILIIRIEKYSQRIDILSENQLNYPPILLFFRMVLSFLTYMVLFFLIRLYQKENFYYFVF